MLLVDAACRLCAREAVPVPGTTILAVHQEIVARCKSGNSNVPIADITNNHADHKPCSASVLSSAHDTTFKTAAGPMAPETSTKGTEDLRGISWRVLLLVELPHAMDFLVSHRPCGILVQRLRAAISKCRDEPRRHARLSNAVPVFPSHEV